MNWFTRLRNSTFGGTANTETNTALQVIDPPTEAPPAVVQLDIPSGVVLRVLAVVGAALMIGQALLELQSLLITFLVAGFFALGLAPLVTRLERWMPRVVAILLVYLVGLGFLIVSLVLVIPIIAEQILQLSQLVRVWLDPAGPLVQQGQDLLNQLGVESLDLRQIATENISSFSEYMSSAATSALGIVTGTFSGLFNVFFTLVVLFFLLLERENIGRSLLYLLPQNRREHIENRAHEVQDKIADWFGGQLLLMLSVGVLTGIGMLVVHQLFGVPHVVTIALLAGFFELFPYIGVSLTGVFALIIAAPLGWPAVLATALVVFIAQMLEGNVLVPYIMKESTGLSSAGVIFALSAGGVLGAALGGTGLAILGMILSIPLAASIALFMGTESTESSVSVAEQ